MEESNNNYILSVNIWSVTGWRQTWCIFVSRSYVCGAMFSNGCTSYAIFSLVHTSPSTQKHSLLYFSVLLDGKNTGERRDDDSCGPHTQLVEPITFLFMPNSCSSVPFPCCLLFLLLLTTIYIYFTDHSVDALSHTHILSLSWLLPLSRMLAHRSRVEVYTDTHTQRVEVGPFQVWGDGEYQHTEWGDEMDGHG